MGKTARRLEDAYQDEERRKLLRKYARTAETLDALREGLEMHGVHVDRLSSGRYCVKGQLQRPTVQLEEDELGEPAAMILAVGILHFCGVRARDLAEAVGVILWAGQQFASGGMPLDEIRQRTDEFATEAGLDRADRPARPGADDQARPLPSSGGLGLHLSYGDLQARDNSGADVPMPGFLSGMPGFVGGMPGDPGDADDQPDEDPDADDQPA